MSVNVDPGPMRDRPIPGPELVPEIKPDKWRRFYERARRFFETLYRAAEDARESTRDKKKELLGWIKRIIEIVLKLIPK